MNLVYAGHTQNGFKPDSGPSFPPSPTIRGAGLNPWLGCKRLFVQILLNVEPSRSRILITKHVWCVRFHTRLQWRSRNSQWESTDQEASATRCWILLQLQTWQRTQSSSQTGFDLIGAKLNASQGSQLTALIVLHICEIPCLRDYKRTKTNKPTNDHPRHFYFLLLSQTLNRVLRWMLILKGNASPSTLHPLKAYMLSFLGQCCSRRFSSLLWRASLQRKSNSCLYPKVFFFFLEKSLKSCRVNMSQTWTQEFRGHLEELSPRIYLQIMSKYLADFSF